MFRRLHKKGQTTAEYAILIALVVGAVLAAQIYVRRGLQGRIRDVVDHVGVGGDVGGAPFHFKSGNEGQYEPYYLSSNAKTAQNATSDEDLKTGGATDRFSSSNTTVNRDQTLGWDGIN